MVPFLQGSSSPAFTESCSQLQGDAVYYVTWAGDRCCHSSLEHVGCPNIGLSKSAKGSIVIVVY